MKNIRYRRVYCLQSLLWIGFTLICSSGIYGQIQTTLPNAPGMERFAEPDHPSSSIAGTVLDPNGAPVSGAKVTLEDVNGRVQQVLVSGDNGEFKFTGLPAETVMITITAEGMATFSSAKIVLSTGENIELPRIVLAIVGATTKVEVHVTQIEVAQEQIKAAEKQRVLGVLPNFYTSYIWNAAPLNAKQKFDLAFHSITDPVQFVGTGVIAGVEQATDTYHGYGQGAQGYGKRYGAAYADNVLGRLIGSAVLASLFHQDPRYFYKGSGSVSSRMFYAMTRAVITRGDHGQIEPNYSHVLGSFAAGGIANLYHPDGDRGIGLTLANGLIDTAGNAVDNLVREFILRRHTSNVPDYEKGKP